MVDPPIALVFLLASLALGGVVALLLGAEFRKRRQAGGWLFVVGAVLIAAAIAVPIAIGLEARVVHFSYSVTLEPVGSGMVRVSLPSPVDETLIGNLAASGNVSSVGMNRTGSEPAIEVTLSGPTTLAATFSARGYAGPYALTRAMDWSDCRQVVPCNATLSVRVISGNVTAVRVNAFVSWGTSCEGVVWSLDHVALPGERDSAAVWVAWFC